MPTDQDQDITATLASEAEAAEHGRDMDAPYVRSTKRSKDPSQVYSVRMPVDRLEELRQLAAREHVAPSALLRRWALERLDREVGHASRVAETHDLRGEDDDEVLVMTRAQFNGAVYRYLEENADTIARLVRRQAG